MYTAVMIALVILVAAASRPARAQSLGSATITPTAGGSFECTAGGFLPNWGNTWYWQVNVDGGVVMAGPGPWPTGSPYGTIATGGTNPFSIDYITPVYHGAHICEFFAWEYGSVLPGTQELWDVKLPHTFP